MSRPRPSSSPGRPPTDRVAASPSRATIIALSFAAGATILGFAALAASALGGARWRVPGLALLAAAGLLAGVVRWQRTKSDVDHEALVQLAIACTELDKGNLTAAGWAASKAVTAAGRSGTRNRALIALAWASLGQGYAERAKAALDQVKPPHELDVYCLAAVQSARGRTDLAIQALEVARSARALNPEGAKLLVDCYVRAFGMERAVLIAIEIRKVLGRDNCEMVVNAARLAGAHAAAATLAAVLRDEGRTTRPPVSGPVPAARG